MKDKFLVKIPLDPENPEAGYKEFKFKTYREIAVFLNTTPNTVKALVDGKVKFAHDQTRHLQDIKVESIENKPSAKTIEERKEYIKNLLEKACQ